MVDITHIFDGPFTPPAQPRFDPAEVQLRDAIEKAGITPPPNITLDGKIHRFRSGTKGSGGHGDKTGWYIGFPDGIPAGRFGCWRAGMEIPWRADVGRELSPVEEMAYARRLAEAMAARKEEERKGREVAAATVEKIWEGLHAASPDHPYLLKKGVLAHGARITDDGRLVLPLYDVDGELSSLQYIDHEGEIFERLLNLN
jgi:putative DNA primase/helicase